MCAKTDGVCGLGVFSAVGRGWPAFASLVTLEKGYRSSMVSRYPRRQHGVLWLLAPVVAWIALAIAIVAVIWGTHHSWEMSLRAVLAVSVALAVVTARTWWR